MKKVVSVFLCLIMVLSVFEVMPFSASAKEVDIAETGRNIAGNGTDGIYINIEAAPYTTFANNGFDAYGPNGCGWFASARANQITGKGTQTWNGSGWWNYGYSVMGYKRGNSIQAKCLACWSNHVAVVEKVDGNRVLMSEGGYSSTSQVLPVGYNNGYCVIRWTNMNDIIYSQSGQGSFLGYVYLGSAPTPANPVFSINDVSDITETNAYISCSQITNPNGGTMTRVGFQMGISSGNYSINKYDDLPSWTSGYITCDYRMSDVGVTLSPGTKYYYRFYIVISGQTFYSDEKSFTTAGKNFESVNLGDDFVAYIINSKAGMNIGANSEGNVELQTKSDSDNQKWHFLRQSDSSYKIINVGRNQCLDVANFGTANGTNIGLCPSNDTNAQRYFIRDNGSGYSIVPKVNTNAALDISGGSLTNGANIQEYTWNGSNAQMFSIDYVGLEPSVTKEYNGHTYEYYNLSVPWNQAYRFCESKGGHLVTISNESENDYVHSMIDNMIWLGGTAYNNNKKWYWITGEPFDYTPWNTSQPDYYDGKEFYLSMYYNSDAPKKWNDLPLNYSIPFVCEYDNDDIKADSYTPTAEVSIDGYTFSVYDYAVDWQTAAAICKAKGGQLVKIDTAKKNDIITQVTAKGGKSEYWINATDRFSEGVWSDGDGASLSYTNWADGEPTNDFNAEEFAVIFKSSGKWMDIKGFCPVYRSTGFICEREDSTKPQPSEDGWIYCSILPSYVNPNDYIIEYDNYYEKQQKDSPGTGWVKAETIKNEWVNSGSQYSRSEELPTSDARILVDTSYYHYCGGSAPAGYSNYALDSTYVHYDSVPNNMIGSRKYLGNDNGHWYYELHDKSGNVIWCQSGVTCDGSYGSHGNRSDVWYATFTYQDRTKVEIYKYTKDSGWTDTADNSATSTKIRYKRKGVLGDVDGDGEVSVIDATYIQRFSIQLQISIKEDVLIKYGDVDGDGEVTVVDATFIQRYDSKIPIPYPVGEPI